MKLIRVCIWLVLVFIVQLSCAAVAQKNFSAIIEQGVATNFIFLAQKSQLDQARAKLKQATGVAYLPQLDYSVVTKNMQANSITDNNISESVQGLEVLGITSPAQIIKDNYYAEQVFNVRASLNLYNGGRSKAKIDLAALQVQIGINELRKVRNNIVIQAIEYNFQFCHLRHSLKSHTKFLAKFAQYINKVVKLGNDLQQEAVLSIYKLKAEYNSLVSEIAQNRLQLHLAVSWFKQNLNTKPVVNCRVKYWRRELKPFLDQDSIDLIRLSLPQELSRHKDNFFAANLDVKIASLRRGLALINHSLAKSSYMPKVDLIADYNQSSAGLYNSRVENISVGLYVSGKLFDPSSQGGNLYAQHKISQAGYNYSQTRLQVENKLLELLGEYHQIKLLLADTRLQLKHLKLEKKNNIILHQNTFSQVDKLKYNINNLRLKADKLVLSLYLSKVKWSYLLSGTHIKL